MPTLPANIKLRCGGDAERPTVVKHDPGEDVSTRYTRWLTILTVLAILTSAPSSPAATTRVNWTSEPGFRWSAIQPGTSGQKGFSRLSSDRSGVHFTNRLSALFAINNQILENGAGLALGDANGDGWADLYLCGSENSNALFLNQGDGRFEEIAVPAGVACPGQFSTGALFADVDGDADLDLLVNGLGTGTRLFLNNGSARFAESTRSGLKRSAAATSMSMADVDTDGDLDLYVACYRATTARDEPETPKITARVVQGRVEVTPADRFFGVLRANGKVEVVEKGEPDTLYLNQGNGIFRAVAWTGGSFLDEQGKPISQVPEDWGLSVLLRDLTGDGHIDIYVCNDFFRSRDRFWIGDGRGRFRAIDPRAWRAMPLSSMSVDAGDLNHDGVDDFLAVEMLSRRHSERQRQRANALKVEHALPLSDPAYVPEVLANTLHLGRGDGTFAETAWLAGLAASDWSWNVALLDVDLDGWEDVLIAAGNNHDVLDMDAQNELDRSAANSNRPALDFYPSLPQRNLIFRNEGRLRFRELGEEWGWSEPGISQALGLADLDNDGDLDVVIGRLNQECLIYLNQGTAPRIAVELRGRSANTEGIGARLRLVGAGLTQQQHIIAGGRYLSADQKRRSFALPASPGSYRLEVEWPSRAVQTISNIVPNRLYQIEEPVAAPLPKTTPPVQQPWFAEVTLPGSIRHLDPDWDELAAQPLLPQLLSRRGPGLTWMDVDADSDEDLVMTTGRGGRTLVLTNQSSVAGVRFTAGFAGAVATNDQLMVLKAGNQVAVSSQSEPGSPALVQEGVPAEDSSWSRSGVTSFTSGQAGPMSVGDYDQDGDLDLWVGGLTRLGRFPESAPSALVLQTPTGWKVDDRVDPASWGLNRVSALISTDLDSDGDLDVVAASEWGGLSVLRNDQGKFTSWGLKVDLSKLSPSVPEVKTLDQLTGFWHGLTAGDFDGDGRMDLVASNQGWNHPSSSLLPWYLYYGDFSGSGGIDLVEAFADKTAEARRVPWRALDALATSLPWIKERFSTYRHFASADIRELLGDSLASAKTLVVRTSTSLILLNRGDYFEARSLPLEAQTSVATGLTVADFDGDGFEDLFVAQNWFACPPETPRSASGRGLLLRGDGRGGFEALSGTASGLRIYGEQRGTATADFDQDGRPDLAVSQNRGSVVLLHNQTARPGLSVKLQGPPGNPECYGASLRLKFGTRWGPRREAHGGSGYLSCDGSITILATPEHPTGLQVRWPDGTLTEHAIDSPARPWVLQPTPPR